MAELVPAIRIFSHIVIGGQSRFMSAVGNYTMFVMAGLVPAIHALQTSIMGWAYILTNKPNGILYIGVTNDLIRRMHEHREGKIDGFSKRYKLTRLVYFEEYETMPLAIQREKSMKRWPRAYKARLINEKNREWRDLSDELL